MKAFIKRAFPVPAVMISPRVSVSISDGVLRFFEFHASRSKPRPKAYGSKPFPAARINALDEKSKVEAINALSEFAKENKCSAARVVIHEGEVYAFRTTVPTSDPREVRAAIEATLEENVPISPSEAVFEYDIVRSDYDKGESVVAASVLSRKSIDAYLELFMAAGIRPVSFDTEACALSRSLFQKDDPLVHAVLSIQPKHSTVFIVQNGAVSFSSSIEVGSKDIDTAVSKTYGIGAEEARNMKLEKAFRPESVDTKLFDAMIPVFSTIRDELVKVLLYWKTIENKEKGFQDVSDIVLCGSDSLISGFSSYVSIVSKLPTSTGSVWTRVLSPEKSVPDLSYKDSLDYGTVIGTLL